MANQLGAIKHIVQLMLENRSFDQMLGFLYTDQGNKSALGHPYEGLTGNEWNPDDSERPVRVYRVNPGTPNCYLRPDADPGEGYHHTNYQLFRTDDPPPGAVPEMKGFVIDFKAAIASDLAKGFKDTLTGTQASEIMGMYSPEALPVMSALAKGYAVCDHWFCSAPTQTLPNRGFAAAATSLGYLQNRNAKFFTTQSIFGLMEKHGVDWSIFGYNRDPLTRHDFPDTLHADDSHFGHFRDFEHRAADGTLSAYTFLEPDWGATGNSQHPNYDVALGEKLIRDTYNAVRTGPAWNETLLIITYDEHGGNFDHVPPPWGATPPDNSSGEFGFDFTRFGVRVPAILVSPRIKAGTVFRVNKGVIDHTSVLKTVETRFNLPALTRRDAAAPHLGDVLTLAQPRADDPLQGIEPPVSGETHPTPEVPTPMDLIHAEKVSALPLRNEKGAYDEHDMPTLTTSAAVGEYIQTRTAAWRMHQQRRHQRRARLHQRGGGGGPPSGGGGQHGSGGGGQGGRAKRGGSRRRARGQK